MSKPTGRKPAGGTSAVARLAADLPSLEGRKLAVLMGGFSAEREISLKSGSLVLEALIRSGLTAWGADLRSWQDLEVLRQRRPDAAVICLHGPGGEDGTLQGALEWMGIPYTGSGVLASALAMDKARSKEIFRARGISTPAWCLLNSPAERLPASLKPPLVVKPNRQGSTVGISIVRSRSELGKALAEARRHDAQVLVEKFVPGQELTVGVLGGYALPVIEIIPKTAFYDFEAKYSPGMSEHIIPARISRRQQSLAQRWALAAHRALGCAGATRTDFILTPQGRLEVLELNTIPGMTATSLLPEAARHAGLSFENLVQWLVADALGSRA